MAGPAGVGLSSWGVIQRSALRAGFRHDGRYKPLERLDIVFAGDTFDLYASRLGQLVTFGPGTVQLLLKLPVAK